MCFVIPCFCCLFPTILWTTTTCFHIIWWRVFGPMFFACSAYFVVWKVMCLTIHCFSKAFPIILCIETKNNFVTSFKGLQLASLTCSHISVTILRLDRNFADSKHFVVWKVIRFPTPCFFQGFSMLCIGAANHLLISFVFSRLDSLMFSHTSEPACRLHAFFVCSKCFPIPCFFQCVPYYFVYRKYSSFLRCL